MKRFYLKITYLTLKKTKIRFKTKLNNVTTTTINSELLRLPQHSVTEVYLRYLSQLRLQTHDTYILS
jgi:hypothetical protein